MQSFNQINSHSIIQQWRAVGLGVAVGSLLGAIVALKTRQRKRAKSPLRIGLLGMGAINSEVAQALVAGSHGLSKKHAELVTIACYCSYKSTNHHLLTHPGSSACAPQTYAKTGLVTTQCAAHH